MSKERELLEKWVSQFGNLRHDFNLLTETKELLAQPETEQEPVAWMWKKHTAGGWLDAVGLDKPIATAHQINIYPLYTAQPKREPLSEDKLDALAEANITDEGIAGYYLGFRDAEKMHGITGVDDE